MGGITKLKILHKSHADFCSTDTAGGLDNKKRRYAPRGGVAYRLSLWGFPKGATPPFGTRLCGAKCSVLYLLAWLTGETGCGASCAPFAPAGKQAEFLRMGMSKKSGCFQQQTGRIMKAPVPRPTLRLVDKVSRSCGHIPGKVAGQRATVKAGMNGFTPGLDRRPPSC